jgi:hypothetical protein
LAASGWLIFGPAFLRDHWFSCCFIFTKSAAIIARWLVKTNSWPHLRSVQRQSINFQISSARRWKYLEVLMTDTDTFLRLDDVQRLTGLSRAGIYNADRREDFSQTDTVVAAGSVLA